PEPVMALNLMFRRGGEHNYIFDFDDMEKVLRHAGFKDDSVKILEKYAEWLTYRVSEPDGGQADAINRGFSHASGDLLNWINSDDLLLPGALRVLAEAHVQHPEDLLLGDVEDAVGLEHLAVFHLFGFGRAALHYHLPRLGFAVVAVRTAPPSQADAYGQRKDWRSILRRSLKMADHAAYRLLMGLNLDRRCWRLSIEAVARKIRGREDMPPQYTRLSGFAG
ncbi:MAG: glycosyltransferase, partial [Candidatus Entotheonellia bacterium]